MGNHRGSIFRLLIGEALMYRGDLAACPSWGLKGDLRSAASASGSNRDAIRAAEATIEMAVSNYIAAMPLTWLAVPDDPGPNSLRGVIERNVIALLSNVERPALDSPSAAWLGRHSGRPLVRASGLWNQRHVDEEPDPRFLDLLERVIE